MERINSISIVLNAFLGLAVALFTAKYKILKEKISGKLSEVDLRRAEKDLEKMLDEAQKEQMTQLITELKQLRKERAEFLKFELEFETRQTELELKVMNLTRKLLIAEQNYTDSRCDDFACRKRIPPLKL